MIVDYDASAISTCSKKEITTEDLDKMPAAYEACLRFHPDDDVLWTTTVYHHNFMHLSLHQDLLWYDVTGRLS